MTAIQKIDQSKNLYKSESSLITVPESTQAQITSSQSKTTRNRPNEDKTKLLIRKRTRRKEQKEKTRIMNKQLFQL